MFSHILGAITFPTVIFLLLMSYTRTPITKTASFKNELGSTSTGAACRVVVPRRAVYYEGPLVLNDLVDKDVAREAMDEFKNTHTLNRTLANYDCFASVDTESWQLTGSSVNYENKLFYKETFSFRYRKPSIYRPVTAIKFVRQCFYQPNSTVQCETTAIHKEIFHSFEIPHEEYVEAIIWGTLEKVGDLLLIMDNKLNINHWAHLEFRNFTLASKIEVIKADVYNNIIYIVWQVSYKLIDISLCSVVFAVVFISRLFEKHVMKKETYVPGSYNIAHQHFDNQTCTKRNCVNKASTRSRIHYISSKPYAVKKV